MKATLTTPDPLLIALAIGIISLLIGIGCLAVVVFTNFGSRTLVNTLIATFGASSALLLSLYFDLRGKTEVAAMSAEYTVDRSKPQIRQWAYPDIGSGWRMTSEIGASEALAKRNPAAFNGDLGKLTTDMTIRSLLAYFFSEEFDWQLRRTIVRGSTTGTQTMAVQVSKPGECTMVARDQIAHKLHQAGNLFDQVQSFIRVEICLPPGSSVDIRPEEVSVTNALVRLSFVVEPTGGVFYGKPRTGGLDAPLLPDGGHQYETRVNNVRAAVTYNWLRAHHADMDNYKAWADRIITGAQKWFEGAS